MCERRMLQYDALHSIFSLSWYVFKDEILARYV
jgi:hypothetical protein